MGNLIGGEMTGAVRFVIAFIVVLALIAIFAWLVRRFGRGALASATGRNRQPRLAVIDAASVDARRRLVLIRRDNVEHLVMIGGPTDVVIEQNIVRAAPASSRDIASGRIPPPMAEPAPPPASLDDSTLWPLQPDPGTRGTRAVAEPPMQATPRHEPAAHSLSTNEPLIQWHSTARQPTEAKTSAAKAAPDTLTSVADAIESETQPPTVPHRAPSHPDPRPAVPDDEQFATPQNDRNLAEMAQRLEAVLRRPGRSEPRLDIPMTDADPPPTRTAAEPAASHEQSARVANEQRPGQSKNFYESLEQEMASLLGRPTGKT